MRLLIVQSDNKLYHEFNTLLFMLVVSYFIYNKCSFSIYIVLIRIKYKIASKSIYSFIIGGLGV